MQRSNVAASVSLASAVATVVLFALTFCANFVPFVGWMCAGVLYPLGWLTAFVAFVSGIVGYRAASAMDDEGKGSALVGIATALVYFVVQGLLLLMAIVFGGLAYVAG